MENGHQQFAKKLGLAPSTKPHHFKELRQAGLLNKGASPPTCRWPAVPGAGPRAAAPKGWPGCRPPLSQAHPADQKRRGAENASMRRGGKLLPR